jgi:PncC family amidohydrolase
MCLIQGVADRLKSTGTTIVFAESCTAGLVSASLARVAGISQFHCGSAVVYQPETKTGWLGISPNLLADPGPVSEQVAREMAVGVLQRTPAARLAASITGHLGPQAPADQDGLIYIGIAMRTDAAVEIFRHILPAEIADSVATDVDSLREWRQWKATETLLNHVKAKLEAIASTRR